MFKIKLVLYLLISDFIIPSHYKTNYACAIRVAGSGRQVIINDTDLSAFNNQENTQEIGTLNGRQINLGLSSNSSSDNTVVFSESPVGFEEPLWNNETDDSKSNSNTNSNSSLPSTKAELITESSKDKTDVGQQQVAENTNKMTEIFKKLIRQTDVNIRDVRTIGNKDQTHHSVDSEPVVSNGDRSVYEQFHELRIRPRHMKRIPWNTTSNTQRILIEEEPNTQPISNKFENNTALVIMASHGLFFNEYAQTLIFHETFQHFIRFPIPTKRELTKAFEKEDCLSFVQRSLSKMNITATRCAGYSGVLFNSFGGEICKSGIIIDITYIKICDRLVHYYDKQTEELQEIINDSYNNFKQNIRKKREIVTATVIVGALVAGGIGGAIAGGIAGWFAGKAAAKDEVAKLAPVLEQMEKNMSIINEAVKVNHRLLCGLSQQVVELERDLKKEMKLMADNFRFQIMNLEESISLVSKTLHEAIQIEIIVKALEDYVNLHLSSLRNIMILELQQIKTWETIFNTLSFGRLPIQLIGYNQLKALLKTIYQTIYTDFEFALNEEEFPLYYTLPIISYVTTQTPEEYVLYVHLKIPLKIVKVNHRFDLITVHPHPFPCWNDECILEKGKLQKGELQSFNLPQLSLLVNPKTFHIQHLINLDYLTCQDNGRKRLCFSFSPNVLQSPTSCIKAIYEWNENEIINWCDFKPARRDEYRVIPITSNSYIVHREIIGYYSQFCKDLPPVRQYIDDWSEIMIIPPFCEVFISATNQKLLGPFSEILKSTSDGQKITYESNLIEKINAKYSNLSSLETPTYDSKRFIRSIEERFRSNRNAATVLDTRLTSDELSKVALFNIRAQKDLENSLSNLNSKFKSYTMTGTLWGILSSIADCIQMLTVLTVIFGILSYSNFFGIFGATLILIHPRAVEAWDIQLIPDITLLPPITVDVLSDTTAIAFFMNIAFVIVFIAFSILFIVYGIFRKIEYSTHYGKGPVLHWQRERTWQLSPCSLMVHLNYKGNLIRCIKVENIRIKLSLDGLFSHEVKNVKVKNPFLNWGIIKREGRLIIVLSEPVSLMGFNAENERIAEAVHIIEIPIDGSAFNSIPRSEAIRKRGNNGLCFVDTVQKSLGVKLRAGTSVEAPPRYIEIMPSCPQLDETYV